MEKESGLFERKNELFRGKHSRSIRFWHWSTFVITTGSLFTVLLAKTLLNTRKNIPVVQENLRASNIAITVGQAKSLAHEFNDMAWNFHTNLGYILAGLFGFRILIEFFQPKEQKVIPILKNTLKSLRQPGTDLKDLKYYLFVRCAYLFFYLVLAVQVCTGLFMVYSDDVEDLKKLRHSVSDIHSVGMWVLLTYIALHIIGVVYSEHSKKNSGIVSDMINGGQN